jgi:hypothetical protein
VLDKTEKLFKEAEDIKEEEIRLLDAAFTANKKFSFWITHSKTMDTKAPRTAFKSTLLSTVKTLCKNVNLALFTFRCLRMIRE